MSSAIFRAASASSTSTKKLRDSKTKQLGNQEFCTKSLKNNVSNLRITESQAQSNLSGDLQIKVLRGENLIEKNFCGGSDPYVILGPYDEKLKNIPKNKKQKTVVRKSINPFWGSKHEVPIERTTKKVLFRIYNKEILGQKSFMGQISISVHRLPKNVEVVRWFNLERRFEYDKVQGQIELKLLLITNEPAEPNLSIFKAAPTPA